MPIWRAVSIAGLAALLGAVGAVGGWQWWQGSAAEARPAFSLPDLEGERRSISEWDGEIIVLNFWATWCEPCRDEMPLFVELQERFETDGVQFVGVAVDRIDPAREFAAELDLNYPSLQGIEAAMEVGARYGNDAGSLPYTVVIDREGYIRHVFHREVSRTDLEPILEEMVGG